jgi:hypothetical protein
MKLIIEREFETHTTEFKNVDVSLEQLFSAFKGSLVSMEWHTEVIDEYIMQLAQEIKESRDVEI